MAASRLTSDEVSACSSNHEISPWPLDFLKARAGGVRRVRIVGERRAEGVSNRLERYACCRRKRKELESDLRCSLNLSEK